jgi:uncharacterized protein (DUF2062 family)
MAGQWPWRQYESDVFHLEMAWSWKQMPLNMLWNNVLIKTLTPLALNAGFDLAI